MKVKQTFQLISHPKFPRHITTAKTVINTFNILNWLSGLTLSSSSIPINIITIKSKSICAMDTQKIRVIRVKAKPQAPPKKDSPKRDIYFYMGGDISKETQDGKLIAENIKHINSNKKRGPMPLFNPGRKPGMIAFLQCLDIYENNQSYHSNNIDELIELERWFSSIPEPYSNEVDWIERENNRKKYGISDYCDEQIRKRLLSKRGCQR